MPALQPPPFRVPLLDAHGQLVETWRRFFLSTQGAIVILQTGTTPTPAVTAAAGYAMAFAGIDQDGESFGIPGAPGPPGPVGNTGPQGPAGLDGDLFLDEPWVLMGGGITRSGQAGLPSAVIVGSGRTVGATGALASVLAYTVGGSDSSFEVSANVLVTASTTHSFTTTVTYTDEGGTARTLTLSFSQITGTFLTAITNVQGTGAYEGIPLHIRAQASTTITVATTGTFTSVTYNVEAILRQLA